MFYTIKKTGQLIHILGLFFFLEMLIPYVKIGPQSVSFLVLIVALFFALLSSAINPRTLDPAVKRQLLYGILLAASLLVSLAIQGTIADNLMVVIKPLAGVFIIFSCILVIRSERDMRLLILYIVAATLTGLLFTYLQLLEVPFVEPLKKGLLSYSSLGEVVTRSSFVNYKPIGLSHTSYYFGFLLTFGAIYFMVRIKNASNRKKSKLAYWLLLFFYVGGLIISTTRSAMLAVAFVFIALNSGGFLSLRAKGRLRILLPSIVIGIVTIVAFQNIFRDTNLEFLVQSKIFDVTEFLTDARISTIIMGLMVGLDSFPIGSGGDQNFVNAAYSLWYQYPAFVDIGSAYEGPHNQFVNTWAVYGFLPCIFTILIALRSLKMTNVGNSWHQVLIRYFFIGMVINTCFHNVTLYNSLLLWILVGLTSASYTLQKTEQPLTSQRLKNVNNN